MMKQRILVLSPAADPIEETVLRSHLRDVPVIRFASWKEGGAALARETFSAVVARKFTRRQSAFGLARDIAALAPRTPLILVLPGRGGPSVRRALSGGAAEVIFEKDLERELVPALEKYLFAGHGLLRPMSLDEMFDFCYPVVTTTDMDPLAYTVIEMFRESLGASCGILFRAQEGSGPGFAIASSTGFPDESTAAVFLLQYGPGIVRLAGPTPSVVPADAVVAPLSGDEVLLGPNRTLFCIRFDLSPVSRMYAVLAMRGTPCPEVLGSPLLSFFHRQTRFALVNAERNAKTQNLIYIDDITKLYNSRYLNVVLDRELKRAERYRNFFSVLFMDLDFFKRVNDSCGHLVGTRVLVEIGSVLRSCVRETDTVVRYGGDEFVVLLVETNAEEALLVAERMRRMIHARRFGQDLGLDIRLTISIGIAAYPEHAATKQHLLNLADQAMYRGKETSRNVVYLATPLKMP